MTLLFYDPLFVEHEMPAQHPERPERVARAWEHLRQTGVDKLCQPGEAKAIPRESLLAVHSQRQVSLIESTIATGGGYLDGDTPVSRRSNEAALLAAGCATAAVDGVLTGKKSNAFCLVRPPGHHATAVRSMGFCLYNNVALAAHHAITYHQLSRVLIVDWDVHHGNGTQDIFYDDPRVMFFSAHRYPFYPGSGSAEETGRGRGLGYTFNMPVTFGTTPGDYRKRFEATLDKAAAKIKPELVLLSAGFDAHRLDPIGSLGLEIEDFLALGQMVLHVADTYAHGQLVSLLEGGYNIDILCQCVEAHVRQLVKG